MRHPGWAGASSPSAARPPREGGKDGDRRAALGPQRVAGERRRGGGRGGIRAALGLGAARRGPGPRGAQRNPECALRALCVGAGCCHPFPFWSLTPTLTGTRLAARLAGVVHSHPDDCFICRVSSVGP